MDENDKAGEPEEQADKTWYLWKWNYGRRHEDWPDPLREPYEPTQDELDLLHSQVPGHRWNAWRCLTSDEAYFAACSCGWRSSETGYVSPMLGQVQDHLNAVRAMRGWGRTFSTAQAPHRDEQERDAGQRQMRAGECARELYASIEGQQQRLAQTAERFSNVLAADQKLADRRVAALEREAARVAQEQGQGQGQEQITAAAQRAEALQRRLERAKELRKGIVSASAAMAVVAEEITWIHQDLETRHQEAIDWIYGEKLVQLAEAKPSSGKARDK